MEQWGLSTGHKVNCGDWRDPSTWFQITFALLQHSVHIIFRKAFGHPFKSSRLGSNEVFQPRIIWFRSAVKKFEPLVGQRLLWKRAHLAKVILHQFTNLGWRGRINVGKGWSVKANRKNNKHGTLGSTCSRCCCTVVASLPKQVVY